MVGVLLVALGACGCGERTAPPAPPPLPPITVPSGPVPETVAPARAPLTPLRDACEPSALVELGGRFVVGDNEVEDQLYVYDATMTPLAPVPLPVPVEDIEALAVLDGQLVVVGSHSVNKKGKPKPDRHRILGLGPQPVALAEEMLGAGLDIEGAAVWRGHVWLGLRGPLAGDKAQLVHVATGAKAGQIEQIATFDLGGQGVRELVPWGDALLVVAGPVRDEAGEFSVWRLSAPEAAPERLPVTLPGSSEGAWVVGDRLRFVVDGAGEPGACVTPGQWGEVPLPAR